MHTREEFDNLMTGDEIHLTSGEIWSIVASNRLQNIWFIRGSFAEAWETNGEFVANSCDELYADSVKNIFWDAVQGGAAIVKNASEKSKPEGFVKSDEFED